MADNTQAKWYIIHTYSGYEKMVQVNLQKLVENNNLGDFIFDIVVPMEDDVVEKADGKKKAIQRKRFPSYVFLKMIYSNHIWFLVTNTRGVTGFVGPAGRPQPLSTDEIRRIGLENLTLEDIGIEVGDTVKVISGAFTDFVGEVKAIDVDKQKMQVSVSMFGRETPVELAFNEVEKFKA